ncbi:hypothetical protein MKW92_024352 [Papaver armeniacum]|nr:hypothetical protein MKW92_024352 [Papaver armeniacum]
MIDKKMEKTFVLAYPCFYYNNCIGNLVAQFEELAGMKITEMRSSVYASESGEQALLDIALWFRASKFDITQSKKIVFMLPKGEVYGPRRNLKPEFKDNFPLENMCVFLIKPLAFRDRCVGEILDAIESNSYGVRGWLTGSLSTIDDDECGLAVVAYHIKSCFNMRSGNIKKIGHDNKVFEIGRVLEAASEFFHHGFSVWENQCHRSVRGGIFEASLVGLESLQ